MGTDQAMSDSILKWEVAWLCFHARYGPTSSGKRPVHSLSALQWRRSREQDRYKLFSLPPKALQCDQRYVTEGKGGGERTRYDCLQFCDCLPLRTHLFIKDILPLIQTWVYVHRIVVDGSVGNDLPVDCTWFPVRCHTQLCNFLAHGCRPTCYEEINNMCSSYKRVIETYDAPHSLL